MFKISISPEEIDILPLTSFDGKIVVVEGIGRNFWEALDYLKKQTLLGFDTETRPSFDHSSPHYGVALLQLSGPDRAYLFRVQKTPFIRKVFKILSNPDIIKVGAACGDDVRGLQRYGRFEGRGFVDLQKIVWEWGIRDKGVRKMAANILGIKISKAQQLSNWEAASLSEAQLKYAATDAWVCREMYLKLLECEKHPLSEEERIPPKQLEQQMQAEKLRAEKRAAALSEASSRRHRRRSRKKKNNANSEDTSQKG